MASPSITGTSSADWRWCWPACSKESSRRWIRRHLPGGARVADTRAAEMRPRVFIVAPGDLFGGAERQILTLCEGHGRQYDVSLFPIFEGPLADRLRAAGFPVTVLGNPPGFLNSVRALR